GPAPARRRSRAPARARPSRPRGPPRGRLRAPRRARQEGGFVRSSPILLAPTDRQAPHLAETRRPLAQPPRLLQAARDRRPRADPGDPLQALPDDPLSGLLEREDGRQGAR